MTEEKKQINLESSTGSDLIVSPTRITGYHYTNSFNYRVMARGGLNKRALKPDKTNNHYYIEGLLSPEPEEWIRNPDYTGVFFRLINDICRGVNEVTLLSFELDSSDDAFVADRAHVEREFERIIKGSKASAFFKYKKY